MDIDEQRSASQSPPAKETDSRSSPKPKSYRRSDSFSSLSEAASPLSSSRPQVQIIEKSEQSPRSSSTPSKRLTREELDTRDRERKEKEKLKESSESLNNIVRKENAVDSGRSSFREKERDNRSESGSVRRENGRDRSSVGGGGSERDRDHDWEQDRDRDRDRDRDHDRWDGSRDRKRGDRKRDGGQEDEGKRDGEDRKRKRDDKVTVVAKDSVKRRREGVDEQRWQAGSFKVEVQSRHRGRDKRRDDTDKRRGDNKHDDKKKKADDRKDDKRRPSTRDEEGGGKSRKLRDDSPPPLPPPTATTSSSFSIAAKLGPRADSELCTNDKLEASTVAPPPASAFFAATVPSTQLTKLNWKNLVAIHKHKGDEINQRYKEPTGVPVTEAETRLLILHFSASVFYSLLETGKDDAQIASTHTLQSSLLQFVLKRLSKSRMTTIFAL
ncbi:UNVERIFIED_CONTAM: hypothetical protein HDU68_006400, partial [Siphonaria sp. JEL0065]